jgi:hypothetical protein
MAFPVNGIIDDFQRANENPLSHGGLWTNPLITGDSNLQVAGTSFCSGTNPVSTSSAYRNNVSYGPDVEVYATARLTDGAALADLYARFDVAAQNGYFLTWDGTTTWRIRRMTGGSNTTLGSNITQAVATGDKFGLECIGSNISFYFKVGAGAWTQIATRSDSTYTGAGRIGSRINGNVMGIDDFGGGTLASASTQSMVLSGKLKVKLGGKLG